MLLLIINPGSTSTKIAVYEDERELLSENIAHPTDELARYDRIVDQKGFRKETVLNALQTKDIDPARLARSSAEAVSSDRSRAASTGSTTGCSRTSPKVSRASTPRTSAG